jgi:hypothetical protein
MLNAIKYAFPSATLEKEFGESKHVMKGIQLREGQEEKSSMAEHDSAEVTASPRLQEIRFDIELVSPDILEGVGTSSWRIVEDSQAKLSFNEDEVVGAYNEVKNLEAITIEQQSRLSSNHESLLTLLQLFSTLSMEFRGCPATKCCLGKLLKLTANYWKAQPETSQ